MNFSNNYYYPQKPGTSSDFPKKKHETAIIENLQTKNYYQE